MSRRSRLRTLVRQMLRPCKRMGATIGRMRTIKILVTGGGSSGHISPALAITDTLGALAVGADWQPRFRYVGGKRGIEQRIVTSAGLDFVGIETGKLRRYFSLENLTDMLRIPVGVGQALAEVRRFDPDIVLSTGGYVGVPPVLAAWLLRKPILTHEQTVQIGLANRITARFATQIALSFASAAHELPPRLRRKTIVTGNPVRALIFGGDGSEGARISGFAAVDDQLPTVYVTGGSQGARIINRAVAAALPELLARCRVIHQCGEQPVGEEQDYDRLAHARAQLPPELRQRYFVTRFVGDEIKHIFALAGFVYPAGADRRRRADPQRSSLRAGRRGGDRAAGRPEWAAVAGRSRRAAGRPGTARGDGPRRADARQAECGPRCGPGAVSAGW